MRKNKNKFGVVLFTLLTAFLLAGCTDDDNDVHSPVTGKTRLYAESGEVYSGQVSALTAYLVTVDGSLTASQNLTVAVAGGETTINLPATPPAEALIDGIGWSEEGSGINMAHYSFERLGIGKTYSTATHLDLYWAEAAIDGEHPLRAGWTWVDAGFNTYASLDEAVSAGNKLYICEQLATFTAIQVGGASYAANSESIGLTFSKEVDGLTDEHVYLTTKNGATEADDENTRGYALAGNINGSGKAWNLTIDEVTAEGEVQVGIDKFGVSRGVVSTEVYSVPVLPDNWVHERWMGDLNATKLISEVAIPGTHDSGTYRFTRSYWSNNFEYSIFNGTLQCQSKSIAQQLSDGIRYLDLRVGYDGLLFHGIFPCNVKLSEAIDACIAHLKRNPTEFIVVELSWEAGQYAHFLESCAPMFEGERANYWYTKNIIPTVQEARGKMVLVNGHNTGKPGLPFPSYGWCGQNDWDTGKASQHWTKRANDKVDLIIKNRNHTINNCSSHTVMHRNCWNKQFNVGVPVETYANYINAKMKSKIWWYPRGIQSMDFYDKENVTRVINSNF